MFDGGALGAPAVLLRWISQLAGFTKELVHQWGWQSRIGSEIFTDPPGDAQYLISHTAELKPDPRVHAKAIQEFFKIRRSVPLLESPCQSDPARVDQVIVGKHPQRKGVRVLLDHPMVIHGTNCDACPKHGRVRKHPVWADWDLVFSDNLQLYTGYRKIKKLETEWLCPRFFAKFEKHVALPPDANGVEEQCSGTLSGPDGLI